MHIWVVPIIIIFSDFQPNVLESSIRISRNGYEVWDTWIGDVLTCCPFLSCQLTQLLPSRLYLILYLWANSFPMPSAWRPWVPTSVMKCNDLRSTWRYSLRPCGSDMMSGHQAPSPPPMSSLKKRGRNSERNVQADLSDHIEKRKNKNGIKVAFQILLQWTQTSSWRQRCPHLESGLPSFQEDSGTLLENTRPHSSTSVFVHVSKT